VAWRGGVGPVTLGARHVKDDSLGLVIDGLGFEDDGAVGMEELVGDICQDGGSAGGDAAFGDEDEKPGEKLADVCASGELGELGEKVDGEVFRVTIRLQGGAGVAQTEMVRAKTEVGFRA